MFHHISSMVLASTLVRVSRIVLWNLSRGTQTSWFVCKLERRLYFFPSCKHLVHESFEPLVVGLHTTVASMHGAQLRWWLPLWRRGHQASNDYASKIHGSIRRKLDIMWSAKCLSCDTWGIWHTSARCSTNSALSPGFPAIMSLDISNTWSVRIPTTSLHPSPLYFHSFRISERFCFLNPCTNGVHGRSPWKQRTVTLWIMYPQTSTRSDLRNLMFVPNSIHLLNQRFFQYASACSLCSVT
jgi:hypothetical protein